MRVYCCLLLPVLLKSVWSRKAIDSLPHDDGSATGSEHTDHAAPEDAEPEPASSRMLLFLSPAIIFALMVRPPREGGWGLGFGGLEEKGRRALLMPRPVSLGRHWSQSAASARSTPWTRS